MAIEKRFNKDGKPTYRVRVPGMKNGKRTNITIATFASMREAKRKEREALAQRDGGTFIDPSRITLADHLAIWLDTKRGEITENVHTDYEIAIRRHIMPALGSVGLRQLTTAMLQAQVNKWRDAGMSAPYIVRICNILSQALEAAVSWNQLPRNVATGLRKPKIEKRAATIWTPAELRRFLAVAREQDENLYPLWQLLASEGMRRGEALGVRWSDLNSNRGTVHVVQKS
jgi:integrase